MGVAYNCGSIVTSGLVLALDAANKKSYSQNEFQYSTDIVTFSGTGGNAATITRDTISSPVGNTPLKMVVTGNDPAVTSMYNTPSTNIAPAANGQTWIVSVYIKANVATTGQIFILGAAADGNVFDAVTGQIAAGGVSIGTDWTRVSYTFTFTKGISFIQVRLDGPDTGGTGQTIWWDGLQVERVPSGTTTPTPFTSSYYGGSVYRDLVGSNNGTLVNYPTYSGSNSGSLSFDGVDDYGNFSSRILTNVVTEISCFMWIYPKSDGVVLAILGQSAINSSYHHSAIEVGSSGELRMSLWHNSLTNRINSTLSLNTWNNVGFTYAGTTLTGYLNGSNVGTTTFTWSKPSDIYFGIMSFDSTNMGTSAYGDGNVSNIQAYNRALTAAEVQQNYNATKSRYT